MLLPTFVVVGAQKAGTTSAHADMSQHPEITMTHMKEIHQFCCRPNGTAEEYAQHLAFDKVTSNTVRGEKTPHYLRDIGCHKRMHAMLPEAKLIVLLRDPVSRIESALKMDGLDAPTMGSIDEERFRSVLAASRYDIQLESLFKLYREDMIHIAFFEDVVKNPLEQYNKMFAFLGVRALRPSEFVRNRKAPLHTSNPRRASVTQSPDLEQELTRRFEPMVAKLETMLNKDIRAVWRRFAKM